MRLVPALVLLSACGAPAAQPIAYRATLERATHGVGLHRDGQTGHAGMFATNCPFETVHGAVTGDDDLPGDGDTVEDVGTSSLGDDTVLLLVDGDAWLIDKIDGVYSEDEIVLDGGPEPVDARLWDRGIVLLERTQRGCRVAWYDGHDLSATATVLGCDEAHAFDVDPETGEALVTSASSAVLVTPDASIGLPYGGSAGAIDPANGAAYVASPGDTQVRAFSLDGSELWTADVGDALTSVGATGEPGGAAIATEGDGFAGQLVLLDGGGAELARVDTPEPATGVVTSADGSTIALVVDTAVHFFAK